MSNKTFLEYMSTHTLSLIKKEMMKDLLEQDEVHPATLCHYVVHVAIIDEILMTRQEQTATS